MLVRETAGGGSVSLPDGVNGSLNLRDMFVQLYGQLIDRLHNIFNFVGKSKDKTQVTSSTTRCCNVSWPLCISVHSSTSCEIAALAPPPFPPTKERRCVSSRCQSKERFDSLKSLCRGTMLPLVYSYSCLIKTVIVKVDEENYDGLQMMTAEAILRTMY